MLNFNAGENLTSRDVNFMTKISRYTMVMQNGKFSMNDLANLEKENSPEPADTVKKVSRHSTSTTVAAHTNMKDCVKFLFILFVNITVQPFYYL